MNTIRLCFALDLVNEAETIAAYEAYHAAGAAWPEITASIRDADIRDMEIYRVQDRLFMIMEVGLDFDSNAKAEADATNPKVAEWEALMDRFQKPLPGLAPGEKWALMRRIYKLGETFSP